MKRKLLLFLLSALGFTTACDHEKEGNGTVDMYGTPRIDFRLQGTVADKAGNPIPGIRVGSAGGQETVFTSEQGAYDLSGSAVSPVTTISFTDIDGAANGGEFKEQALTVEFTEAERIEKGDGSWYKGKYARENEDVTLDEKK